MNKLYFISRWIDNGISSDVTRAHPLKSKITNVISWQELSEEEVEIFEKSRIHDPRAVSHMRDANG